MLEMLMEFLTSDPGKQEHLPEPGEAVVASSRDSVRSGGSAEASEVVREAVEATQTPSRNADPGGLWRRKV